MMSLCSFSFGAFARRFPIRLPPPPAISAEGQRVAAQKPQLSKLFLSLRNRHSMKRRFCAAATQHSISLHDTFTLELPFEPTHFFCFFFRYVPFDVVIVDSLCLLKCLQNAFACPHVEVYEHPLVYTQCAWPQHSLFHLYSHHLLKGFVSSWHTFEKTFSSFPRDKNTKLTKPNHTRTQRVAVCAYTIPQPARPFAFLSHLENSPLLQRTHEGHTRNGTFRALTHFCFSSSTLSSHTTPLLFADETKLLTTAMATKAAPLPHPTSAASRGAGRAATVKSGAAPRAGARVVVAPSGLIRSDATFEDQVKEYNERRAQLSRHRELIEKLRQEREESRSPQRTVHKEGKGRNGGADDKDANIVKAADGEGNVNMKAADGGEAPSSSAHVSAAAGASRGGAACASSSSVSSDPFDHGDDDEDAVSVGRSPNYPHGIVSTSEPPTSNASPLEEDSSASAGGRAAVAVGSPSTGHMHASIQSISLHNSPASPNDDMASPSSPLAEDDAAGVVAVRPTGALVPSQQQQHDDHYDDSDTRFQIEEGAALPLAIAPLQQQQLMLTASPSDAGDIGRPPVSASSRRNSIGGNSGATRGASPSQVFVREATASSIVFTAGDRSPDEAAGALALTAAGPADHEAGQTLEEPSDTNSSGEISFRREPTESHRSQSVDAAAGRALLAMGGEGGGEYRATIGDVPPIPLGAGAEPEASQSAADSAGLVNSRPPSAPPAQRGASAESANEVPPAGGNGGGRRKGRGRRHLFVLSPPWAEGIGTTTPRGAANFRREKAKAYLHALFMSHLTAKGLLPAPQSDTEESDGEGGDGAASAIAGNPATAAITSA